MGSLCMPLPRRLLITLCASASLLSGPALTVRADDQPASASASASSLWSDFNHFVRVARPDLAAAAGTTLLNTLDAGKLLDLVESNRDYGDYDVTLQRAARVDTLHDVALKLAEKIQSARIARAQDPARIKADIARLADGERANVNAIARLRAAGQYAAPQLLATLLDEKQKNLHPYVLSAMISIGRPLVYPLSSAMISLEPVQQGQVAQVLAEIGYPRALPYIKQLIETPSTDPRAKELLTSAYKRISDPLGLPDNVSASELFLTLAQNHYAAATKGQSVPGYEASDTVGIVWNYDRTAGLIPVSIPVEIYGDVLAMKAARTALEMDPKLDPALSLWLAANLRRANRLPDGKTDLSYPATLLSPNFYLEMSGPMRQHDVLGRALNDRDTLLALDAIGALAATAGTDALVNREGASQPLLRALSYPDRRVRYAAAFTFTNAHPKAEFPGSKRIVPILSEALRQTDQRYALVLADDETTVNRIKSYVTELGYQTIGASTIDGAADQIAELPGVDLIIMSKSANKTIDLHRQASTDYKLASVPTIALVSPADQIELNRVFDGDSTILSAISVDKAADLKAAVEAATKGTTGNPITADEALQYANTAINLLHGIAIDRSNVFGIAAAQPALLEALFDKRPNVAVEASTVLALIDSPEVQKALADAALDVTRPNDQRIALLNSLSTNATGYGDKLSDIQLEKILDLVKNSKGDLAIAAARAHGALTLPTENVVKMISGK